MATSQEVAFLNSYRQDFELVYQQKQSRLFNAVRNETQNVFSDFYGYLGALTDDDTEDGIRHADTEWTEVEHLRRRVTLAHKDKAVPLDKADQHMMGPYDPTAGYVKLLTSYFARWYDRKCLSAMGGTAYTGEAGATSVNNYDSGECRLMDGDGAWATAGSDHSATTDTALTVAKLNDIAGMMTDADVPPDNRFIAVNDYQLTGLFEDTTFDGEEIRDIRNIRTRQFGMFMGFQFIVLPTSQFTINATDTTCIECYAWHRDAVVMATGKGSYVPELDIAKRPDKKNVKQIFTEAYAGGTRLQGPGVIEVLLKYAA